MLVSMVCDITKKGVDTVTSVPVVQGNPLNEIPEAGMEREKQSLELLE